MAMRKDQIPDNKFTLPLDARELALYTRQITKNAKVFDLEIDASLPGQLRATADRIFFDIFGANDLRLDKPNEREERFKFQRHAVRLCTVLLAEIDMAKASYHLSGKRCSFWGNSVRDIRQRCRDWHESDAKRAKAL